MHLSEFLSHLRFRWSDLVGPKFFKAVLRGNQTARELLDSQPGGTARYLWLYKVRYVFFTAVVTLVFIGLLLHLTGITGYVIVAATFVGLLGWLIFSSAMLYDDFLRDVTLLARYADRSVGEMLKEEFPNLVREYHLKLKRYARLVLTAEQYPSEFASRYQLSGSDEANVARARKAFKERFDVAKRCGLLDADKSWDEFFELARQDGPFQLDGKDKGLPIL